MVGHKVRKNKCPETCEIDEFTESASSERTPQCHQEIYNNVFLFLFIFFNRSLLVVNVFSFYRACVMFADGCGGEWNAITRSQLTRVHAPDQRICAVCMAQRHKGCCCCSL